MNYSIHTAEAFKLPIASQSKSWNLGAENVIARLAFAASLESSEPIELGELLDSKGKEYNSRVLFGGLKDTAEFLELVQRFGWNHDTFVAFLLFLQATEVTPRFTLDLKPGSIQGHGCCGHPPTRFRVGHRHQQPHAFLGG